MVNAPSPDLPVDKSASTTDSGHPAGNGDIGKHEMHLNGHSQPGEQPIDAYLGFDELAFSAR
jgi:hypothetical protein